MAESQDLPVSRRELRLDSQAATEGLARKVAAVAAERDVIALHGGLGAGKTTFARAFLRARPGGASIAETPSPTFTLVQVYDLAPPVWHFDLYRLTNPDDVWELGVEEAFAAAISLIEWPERMGDLLPAERLDVELRLDETAEGARIAEVTGRGGWSTRLDGLA